MGRKVTNWNPEHPRVVLGKLREKVKREWRKLPTEEIRDKLKEKGHDPYAIEDLSRANLIRYIQRIVECNWMQQYLKQVESEEELEGLTDEAATNVSPLKNDDETSCNDAEEKTET